MFYHLYYIKSHICDIESGICYAKSYKGRFVFPSGNSNFHVRIDSLSFKHLYYNNKACMPLVVGINIR